MPRFVILRHETPAGYPRPAHFDLMLEQGDALWTWALPEIPTTEKSVVAERLRDHRREYLEFEGEVSGDRGSVRRVEQGSFELVSQADGDMLVRLFGTATQKTLLLKLESETQRWRISVSAD